VAILMMLQTRGQVTADEVAAELEVSERTARRDLESLGVAGLPVYSQAGRGGGWRLLGGGKTDLSGLNASEVHALFLLAGQQSGVAPEIRAALRKLTRALPEPFREEAEVAAQALVRDPLGWSRGQAPDDVRTDNPQQLGAVQEAVIRCRQIELGYVARDSASSTRLIDPLGLATKGRSWYLIANTGAGLRTFRVDRITSVRETGEAATRPPGFNLAESWRLISDEIQHKRLPFHASGWVHPAAVGQLRYILGESLRIGPPGDDGWVEVGFRCHSARSLVGQIAGFGAAIKVAEPEEVRQALADLGRELTDLYS
jgi:predicted DNA-binding transcriptional regulator YafY